MITYRTQSQLHRRVIGTHTDSADERTMLWCPIHQPTLEHRWSKTPHLGEAYVHLWTSMVYDDMILGRNTFFLNLNLLPTLSLE